MNLDKPPVAVPRAPHFPLMRKEELHRTLQEDPESSILEQKDVNSTTAAPAFKSGKPRLDILRTHFLRGPSIWTYRPALEAFVDLGELEDFPSNKLPGLPERLARWLPTLVEHRCGVGERGGFLMRLHEGTWCGHILEHLMIELQNLAGIATGFGKARETGRRGVYKVVVATPDEVIGRAALDAARQVLLAAIEDRTCDVQALVASLRALARSRALNEGTQCILDAARERRIPWLQLEGGKLVQLGHGKRQRRLWADEPMQTGAIAETIAGKRAIAGQLLQAAGLPVAHSRIVDSAEEAWEEAQEIGLPVVLAAVERLALPASAALSTREQIEAGYTAMAASGQRLVVEQAVPGSLHRLLVVGTRVVAALRMDGSGRDISEILHPETAEQACLAARVIGLEIAGIDLVAQDIARPLAAQQGAIVRVDPRPELGLHAAARCVNPPPVGQAVLDHLFDGDAANARIPIVGVAGSTGTTVVARLIARLLGKRGAKVGMACSEGLYLNQRQLEAADCSDWNSVQRLLMNRGIEAAVIENGPRTILSTGLGYDRCAVGVVTSIDPAETLPEFYIEQAAQMVNVLRTQVDVVLPSGCAVLNAADPLVAGMAKLCDGEVIFFASHAEVPALAEHLAQGGRAVYLCAGRILFAKGNTHTPVAGPATLPLPHSPELTQVLAAAAAAWASGMTPQEIGAELADFLDELRSDFDRAVPGARAAHC